MDNRINKIRQAIWALRVSMREAESLMREQINMDEDCTLVAEKIIEMRSVMSELVKERTLLGDTDPIVVASLFIPRRARTPPRICDEASARTRRRRTSDAREVAICHG